MYPISEELISIFRSKLKKKKIPDKKQYFLENRSKIQQATLQIKNNKINQFQSIQAKWANHQIAKWSYN